MREASLVSQNFESFGKYILLEKLAMGGMAELYLARSPGASGVSKFIAIKRILPQFSEQIEFIDMFKDEAKIAVNLSHANIVSIFEFGMEKNQFFLAMDYVEGRNLRQIQNKMKKSGLAFSIEQVLYIIKEVAAGLDHAHRCIDANTGKPLNIIHRDMSPQNIMVSFEGEVKVIDFGIAKAETQLETTRAGTLKGKFGYMSPEQAEGQNVDLRTDVFALGIVLWELLANDRLFVANNEVNTLRKIRDCQVPSLRKINPNIPQELERIVSKALSKDRNMRYQTSAAFHRELSRFLNRQYPDFSPQDFSVFVKTLFAAEILEARKKAIEYSKAESKQEDSQPTGQSAVRTFENTVLTASNSFTDTTEPDDGSQARDLKAPSSDEVRKKPMSSSAKPDAAISVAQPQAAPATVRPGFATPPPWKGEVLSVDRGSYNERGSDLIGRGGVREGSVSNVQHVTHYGSRPGDRRQKSSGIMTPLILILIVIAASAGLVYTHGPQQVKAEITRQFPQLKPQLDLLAEMVSGKNTRNAYYSSGSGAGDLASKMPVEIAINSVPAGAEISINGKPRDLTPTTIEVEEGSDIVVSISLRGYAPYEQKLGRVTSKRVVEATLMPQGYLNIIVAGAGQIYIDGKMIAQGSPVNRHPVPADQDLTVSTYDPVTKTGDQRAIRVKQGESKSVQLVPKGNYQPPQPAQRN
jgi:serine/threonine protein kinase